MLIILNYNSISGSPQFADARRLVGGRPRLSLPLVIHHNHQRVTSTRWWSFSTFFNNHNHQRVTSTRWWLILALPTPCQPPLAHNHQRVTSTHWWSILALPTRCLIIVWALGRLCFMYMYYIYIVVVIFFLYVSIY